MKIFNKCGIILLGIAPLMVGAAANFDLINTNFGLPNAPVVYYQILRPNRLNPEGTKSGHWPIKQLKGNFGLRANIAGNIDMLELLLSASSDMSNPEFFSFSPQLLSRAISILGERADALKKKKNKTAKEKQLLETMQKGAVNATTCYISATIKSPTDKTIVLSPQNPTSQYSKQTAQGLPLAANVSPALLSILEELSKPWEYQMVYSLAPDTHAWREKIKTTDFKNLLDTHRIPEYVFQDATKFANMISGLISDCIPSLGKNQDLNKIAVLTQKIITIFKSNKHDDLINNLRQFNGAFVVTDETKALCELVVREFFGKITALDGERNDLENLTKQYATQAISASHSNKKQADIYIQYLEQTNKFEEKVPAWKRLANIIILVSATRQVPNDIREDILSAGEKYKFMFRN